MEQGYASQTLTNYAKCVNRYLVWIGSSDLCFRRGQAKDLTGMRFGRLTVLYPTDERYRKDVIWHCRCDCGKEADAIATRLISGNTTSCGCRKGEALFYYNKYYEGTSIVQSMTERLLPTNTSGYTGVSWKKGGWIAQIQYKGIHYSLGHYAKIEDAAEAYKRAKARVQDDAESLLEGFERDFPKPERKPKEKTEVCYIKPANEGRRTLPEAVRTNNTSGTTGVCRKRDKWTAKITWQGRTFSLGSYERIEEAIEARRGAERLLKENTTDVPEAIKAYRKTLTGCSRE